MFSQLIHLPNAEHKSLFYKLGYRLQGVIFQPNIKSWKSFDIWKGWKWERRRRRGRWHFKWRHISALLAPSTATGMLTSQSPSSQDFIFIYICTSIFILIFIYAIPASLSPDIIFKFSINIILTYIFAFIGAKSMSKSNHTMFNFVKWFLWQFWQ